MNAPMGEILAQGRGAMGFGAVLTATFSKNAWLAGQPIPMPGSGSAPPGRLTRGLVRNAASQLHLAGYYGAADKFIGSMRIRVTLQNALA